MSRKMILLDKVMGIDHRFSKDVFHFYEGRNFFTKSGSLFSRFGTKIMATSPDSSEIKSMFPVVMPTVTSSIIFQQGITLRKLQGTTFTAPKTDCNAATFKGCRWLNSLILVNGHDKLRYNFSTDAFTDLTVVGDSTVPNLERVVSWKSRVFGWMPSSSTGHILYFCGYDINGMVDPTVWPPVFTLDIGGDVGSPILAALPSSDHLLCLTENSFIQVYGNTESDFTRLYGGSTNVLNSDVCQAINGIIFWIGKDLEGMFTVYVYSGTSATPISEPIAGFLQQVDFSKVFTASIGNQYWIICPNEGEDLTTCYIYDIIEKDWYIYDIPGILSNVVNYDIGGVSDNIVMSTNEGLLVNSDPSILDDYDASAVNTRFTVGPINSGNLMMKSRTLYVTALVKNSFLLDLSLTVDGKEEKMSKSLEFDLGDFGERLVTIMKKLPKVRGRNMYINFSSIEKIENLQSISYVISPRGVK